MDVKGLVALLTVLASSSLPAQSVKYNIDTSKKSDTNYAILLDAGSTGSKIKIYSWRKPQSPSVPIQLSLIDDKKVKPPLNTFYGKTAKLRRYLKRIFTWTQSKIPPEQHSKTPLFVLATAGMRYLSGKKSDYIVSAIKDALGDTSFNPFAHFRRDDVDILSGEEEAVYGWIAVNYLLGFFNGTRSSHESAGLLEMGGGSTQIAFVPKGPLYAEEFQVRLAGRVYSVYVQSYLQFGANGIKIKVADALMRRQENDTHVEDPCSLQGDESEVTFQSGASVRILGTGSPSECLDVLEDILKPATGVACQPKPCSIGRVYQPSVENITFYATQAYGFAANNLGVIGPDGIFNMSLLLEKVRAYCKLPLSEVLKNPDAHPEYASADCLHGLYIPALLQTYGFSMDTDSIRVTSKINSFKIDWAMGAMLVKLSDRFYHQGVARENKTVSCPGRSKGNSAPAVKANHQICTYYFGLMGFLVILKNNILYKLF